MSEVKFWDWLKGLLPRGRYDRIESPETALGFPDVDYTISGGYSGKLELKDARFPGRRPPFRNDKDGLHASQIHWILEHMKVSGVCWIVARVSPRVYWIHGKKAARFNGCKDLRVISTYVLEGHFIRPKDVKMIGQMMRGESV